MATYWSSSCSVALLCLSWRLTVCALELANIDIIEGPGMLVKKQITGYYSSLGTHSPAFGFLEHVHPRQLCSDYFLLQKDSILVIKLETGQNHRTVHSQLCLTPIGQIKRSMELRPRVVAIVYLSASYPDIYSTLDEIAPGEYSTPLIVIDSIDMENRLFVMMETRMSMYVRVSPLITSTAELPTTPFSQAPRKQHMVYIILGSSIGVVLLCCVAALSLVTSTTSDGIRQAVPAAV